jgi:hypothetical protein
MSTAEIIHFEGPRNLASVAAKPPAVFLAGPEASERFWEGALRQQWFRCWKAMSRPPPRFEFFDRASLGTAPFVKLRRDYSLVSMRRSFSHFFTAPTSVFSNLRTCFVCSSHRTTG